MSGKLVIIIVLLCAGVGAATYFVTVNNNTTLSNNALETKSVPTYPDARGNKGKATIGDGENIVSDFLEKGEENEK